MQVLLVSTYELGRQPFGIASPAAQLREAGHSVACLDLAVEQLDAQRVLSSQIICFYVPMHTATRMALAVLDRIRRLNPDAHICFYGLYAPINEGLFRSVGAGTVLGGEFESNLVAMVNRIAVAGGEDSLQTEPVISLDRLSFIVPDRTVLPDLHEYGTIKLQSGEIRSVGYTEATRGCKHLCRHCPVVPVYGGNFRIIPIDIILADIRQQVAAGASHITFGDPDFFNGPGHALKLVSSLHDEWPDLTYDVTIKVEHLLRSARHLPTLLQTGCILVTTAVESVDPTILAYFDKRHSPDDLRRVVELMRQFQLPLNPTFVAFTPWTTMAGYLELLETIHQLDLVEHISPVQYGIRLLIPSGSRLLELPETREIVGPFNAEALLYPWTHNDSRVDQLQQEVMQVVAGAHKADVDRTTIFHRVWELAHRAAGFDSVPDLFYGTDISGQVRQRVPHLSEPWYC